MAVYLVHHCNFQFKFDDFIDKWFTCYKWSQVNCWLLLIISWKENEIGKFFIRSEYPFNWFCQFMKWASNTLDLNNAYEYFQNYLILTDIVHKNVISIKQVDLEPTYLNIRLDKQIQIILYWSIIYQFYFNIFLN